MRKGENIFKRKDGRWEGRYIKGREPSGKSRYGYCYGRSYREVKEKVAQCRAALAAGEAPPQTGSGGRLGLYCDRWLRQRRGGVRESTYIKYTAILEKHIKPGLGACPLREVTTAAVDAFTESLLHRDGLAAKTVRDILVVLRSVLKYAAAQIPAGLPAVEISYPKEERREMRVLSRQEQERFVRYLLTDTDACKLGVLLMLLSGLRIGELCALKWGNIDPEEGIIRVAATLQRLHDTAGEGEKRTRLVMGAPKSDTSARTIPMTAQAAALCRRFQVRNDGAFVLTGTVFCMEPRTVQYRIERYTAACGLEGVHAHTLRHTFATRAVEVGFELKSLSEVLGHANTTITLERYVHSSMELKRANMDKLAAAGL